ncbi:DOPA 4,5-dioxygenase [Sphaerosporella brunnea]|uniref:DOPA 4,5-dioxygenase n=1 Tax=Sphaerosporella brunnea TaxID=1250544 RepID=A0A5J5EXN0_9PEZI|nr:DOPA 4,5-dioxygenase [Sphaerosporella brunnea]
MDPAQYTYASPLAGWENHEPLPEQVARGKSSLVARSNGHGESSAYTAFPAPITNGTRGGFDIHVYHNAANAKQAQFARELHDRIRLEFPELRIYKFWDKPIGPHTMAMFEVNVFTPHQLGAFVAWLVINRGPLSVLLHPNTDDELRDHTQRATWLGERVPVDTTLFYEWRGKNPAEERARVLKELMETAVGKATA